VNIAVSVGDALGLPTETPLRVRVWVLLGDSAGDNAQLLRLAEALGWPFEAKRIRYNRLNRCPNLLLGASRLTVDTRRSDPLAPPWPDLVVGASRRAAPLARWIKKQSGGRSRLVHLQHAQAPLRYFDLVVTTPQYRLPERCNVLHNLLPLNAKQPEVLESSGAQWRGRLEHLPRPWIAVLVGGNTASYRLDAFTASQLGQFANRTAREKGGSLLISSSPRTPPDAADALLAAVQCPAYVYRWQPTNKDENPYLAYLALADRFIVTADSASMLAEACSTGRPVELFGWTRPRRQPKRPLRAFPRYQRLEEALIDWGIIKPKRDFQALHRKLMERGLVCPPGQEQSLQPAKPDDLARTVSRIRWLMDEGERSRAPREPEYQREDSSPNAATARITCHTVAADGSTRSAASDTSSGTVKLASSRSSLTSTIKRSSFRNFK
jgi:mitochondrial fission protein ELM1